MTSLADLTGSERAILALVRRKPGTNRAAIAAELGLSPSLLTKSMTKFHAAGLVDEERDRQIRGRGQPALQLRIRPGAVGALGVSLSTTGISVAAQDLDGRLLDCRWLPIPANRTDEGLSATEAALEEMLGMAQSFAGIGVWLPALQNEAGEVVEVTPSQRSIDYGTYCTWLAKRFSAPVWLEAKAPAYHEAMLSSADSAVVYMLYLDYGIGGSLIDHMRLFRGGFGEASNIGAMLPDSGPRPSLPDLARYLGMETQALTMQRLQAMAKDRSPTLSAWMESRGETLSLPLSTVVHLINPTAIVVGGLFPREILEGLAAHVRLDKLDHPGRRPLAKPALRVASATGHASMAVAAASVPFVHRLVPGNSNRQWVG